MASRSQRELMLAGEFYDACKYVDIGRLFQENEEHLTSRRATHHRLCQLYRRDKELFDLRNKAYDASQDLNAIATTDKTGREAKIRQLLGKVGSNPFITPPFACDYGCHITAGDNLYMNFGCVILDCAAVTLGDNILFGPNVQLYAATHPTDPQLRVEGKEMAYPISIGNNVWIGGSAIVCPGVTIGDDTTIGAGSVVTKNIPARCVAAGNPCKVIRYLDGQTSNPTSSSTPKTESQES